MNGGLLYNAVGDVAQPVPEPDGRRAAPRNWQMPQVNHPPFPQQPPPDFVFRQPLLPNRQPRAPPRQRQGPPRQPRARAPNPRPPPPLQQPPLPPQGHQLAAQYEFHTYNAHVQNQLAYNNRHWNFQNLNRAPMPDPPAYYNHLAPAPIEQNFAPAAPIAAALIPAAPMMPAPILQAPIANSNLATPPPTTHISRRQAFLEAQPQQSRAVTESERPSNRHPVNPNDDRELRERQFCDDPVVRRLSQTNLAEQAKAVYEDYKKLPEPEPLQQVSQQRVYVRRAFSFDPRINGPGPVDHPVREPVAVNPRVRNPVATRPIVPAPAPAAAPIGSTSSPSASQPAISTIGPSAVSTVAPTTDPAASRNVMPFAVPTNPARLAVDQPVMQSVAPVSAPVNTPIDAQCDMGDHYQLYPQGNQSLAVRLPLQEVEETNNRSVSDQFKAAQEELLVKDHEELSQSDIQQSNNGVERLSDNEFREIFGWENEEQAPHDLPQDELAHYVVSQQAQAIESDYHSGETLTRTSPVAMEVQMAALNVKDEPTLPVRDQVAEDHHDEDAGQDQPADMNDVSKESQQELVAPNDHEDPVISAQVPDNVEDAKDRHDQDIGQDQPTMVDKAPQEDQPKPAVLEGLAPHDAEDQIAAPKEPVQKSQVHESERPWINMTNLGMVMSDSEDEADEPHQHQPEIREEVESEEPSIEDSDEPMVVEEEQAPEKGEEKDDEESNDKGQLSPHAQEGEQEEQQEDQGAVEDNDNMSEAPQGEKYLLSRDTESQNGADDELQIVSEDLLASVSQNKEDDDNEEAASNGEQNLDVASNEQGIQPVAQEVDNQEPAVQHQVEESEHSDPVVVNQLAAEDPQAPDQPDNENDNPIEQPPLVFACPRRNTNEIRAELEMSDTEDEEEAEEVLNDAENPLHVPDQHQADDDDLLNVDHAPVLSEGEVGEDSGGEEKKTEEPHDDQICPESGAVDSDDEQRQDSDDKILQPQDNVEHQITSSQEQLCKDQPDMEVLAREEDLVYVPLSDFVICQGQDQPEDVPNEEDQIQVDQAISDQDSVVKDSQESEEDISAPGNDDVGEANPSVLKPVDENQVTAQNIVEEENDAGHAYGELAREEDLVHLPLSDFVVHETRNQPNDTSNDDSQMQEEVDGAIRDLELLKVDGAIRDLEPAMNDSQDHGADEASQDRPVLEPAVGNQDAAQNAADGADRDDDQVVNDHQGHDEDIGAPVNDDVAEVRVWDQETLLLQYLIIEMEARQNAADGNAEIAAEAPAEELAHADEQHNGQIQPESSSNGSQDQPDAVEPGSDESQGCLEVPETSTEGQLSKQNRDELYHDDDTPDRLDQASPGVLVQQQIMNEQHAEQIVRDEQAVNDVTENNGVLGSLGSSAVLDNPNQSEVMEDEANEERGALLEPELNKVEDNMEVDDEAMKDHSQKPPEDDADETVNLTEEPPIHDVMQPVTQIPEVDEIIHNEPILNDQHQPELVSDDLPQDVPTHASHLEKQDDEMIPVVEKERSDANSDDHESHQSYEKSPVIDIPEHQPASADVTLQRVEEVCLNNPMTALENFAETLVRNAMTEAVEEVRQLDRASTSKKSEIDEPSVLYKEDLDVCGDVLKKLVDKIVQDNVVDDDSAGGNKDPTQEARYQSVDSSEVITSSEKDYALDSPISKPPVNLGDVPHTDQVHGKAMNTKLGPEESIALDGDSEKSCVDNKAAGDLDEEPEESNVSAFSQLEKEDQDACSDALKDVVEKVVAAGDNVGGDEDSAQRDQVQHQADEVQPHVPHQENQNGDVDPAIEEEPQPLDVINEDELQHQDVMDNLEQQPENVVEAPQHADDAEIPRVNDLFGDVEEVAVATFVVLRRIQNVLNLYNADIQENQDEEEVLPQQAGGDHVTQDVHQPDEVSGIRENAPVVVDEDADQDEEDDLQNIDDQNPEELVNQPPTDQGPSQPASQDVMKDPTLQAVREVSVEQQQLGKQEAKGSSASRDEFEPPVAVMQSSSQSDIVPITSEEAEASDTLLKLATGACKKADEDMGSNQPSLEDHGSEDHLKEQESSEPALHANASKDTASSTTTSDDGQEQPTRCNPRVLHKRHREEDHDDLNPVDDHQEDTEPVRKVHRPDNLDDDDVADVPIVSTPEATEPVAELSTDADEPIDNDDLLQPDQDHAPDSPVLSYHYTIPPREATDSTFYIPESGPLELDDYAEANGLVVDEQEEVEDEVDEEHYEGYYGDSYEFLYSDEIFVDANEEVVTEENDEEEGSEDEVLKESDGGDPKGATEDDAGKFADDGDNDYFDGDANADKFSDDKNDNEVIDEAIANRSDIEDNADKDDDDDIIADEDITTEAAPAADADANNDEDKDASSSNNARPHDVSDSDEGSHGNEHERRRYDEDLVQEREQVVPEPIDDPIGVRVDANIADGVAVNIDDIAAEDNVNGGDADKVLDKDNAHDVDAAHQHPDANHHAIDDIDAAPPHQDGDDERVRNNWESDSDLEQEEPTQANDFISETDENPEQIYPEPGVLVDELRHPFAEDEEEELPDNYGQIEEIDELVFPVVAMPASDDEDDDIENDPPPPLLLGRFPPYPQPNRSLIPPILDGPFPLAPEVVELDIASALRALFPPIPEDESDAEPVPVAIRRGRRAAARRPGQDSESEDEDADSSRRDVRSRRRRARRSDDESEDDAPGRQPVKKRRTAPTPRQASDSEDDDSDDAPRRGPTPPVSFRSVVFGHRLARAVPTRRTRGQPVVCPTRPADASITVRSSSTTTVAPGFSTAAPENSAVVDSSTRRNRPASPVTPSHHDVPSTSDQPRASPDLVPQPEQVPAVASLFGSPDATGRPSTPVVARDVSPAVPSDNSDDDNERPPTPVATRTRRSTSTAARAETVAPGRAGDEDDDAPEHQPDRADDLVLPDVPVDLDQRQSSPDAFQTPGISPAVATRRLRSTSTASRAVASSGAQQNVDEDDDVSSMHQDAQAVVDQPGPSNAPITTPGSSSMITSRATARTRRSISTARKVSFADASGAAEDADDDVPMHQDDPEGDDHQPSPSVSTPNRQSAPVGTRSRRSISVATLVTVSPSASVVPSRRRRAPEMNDEDDSVAPKRRRDATDSSQQQLAPVVPPQAQQAPTPRPPARRRQTPFDQALEVWNQNPQWANLVIEGVDLTLHLFNPTGRQTCPQLVREAFRNSGLYYTHHPEVQDKVGHWMQLSSEEQKKWSEKCVAIQKVQKVQKELNLTKPVSCKMWEMAMRREQNEDDEGEE